MSAKVMELPVAPAPKWIGSRPICTSECPHNQDNHPMLAFSNMCQLTRESVTTTEGGPCWPTIATLTAERDRLAARVAELEKEMARGMSVAFERERCAKIAEKHREELAHDEAVFTKERDRNSAHLLGECASVAADIAAAIRAIAPKEPT